ncbi:exported protein of unknown function (plasmid) [Cupriavidus taiwanensis]|uniref:Uncharacterized protein n=1 Tax=Cupriavidus taiwanensis TaxID=164546 RepID=A0A375ILC9_9BURK|nr:exported hypothetical protein [Cupriavidus taiwanensis]SOY73038.1 exported hypothetical protein [Cupriavidus taiwanensis]SOY97035.1 exported hypothetical protein [Cupriavidus taiwanensis]SOZ84137.1 exported hypothetical protein [Cupriavidus taiwanensis]SPA52772.1 exported hypothetical protein [Cupriavidus taiwanensis]
MSLSIWRAVAATHLKLPGLGSAALTACRQAASGAPSRACGRDASCWAAASAAGAPAALAADNATASAVDSKRGESGESILDSCDCAAPDRTTPGAAPMQFRPRRLGESSLAATASGPNAARRPCR